MKIIDDVLYLRPSDIAKFSDCSYQFQLQEMGVRANVKPINLAFGTALHFAIEHYLLGDCSATAMESMFSDKFESEISTGWVELAYTKPIGVFEAIGKKLVLAFPAWFDGLNLDIALIEHEMMFKLNDKTGLTMTLDFAGTSKGDLFDHLGNLIGGPGSTVIVDWKSVAQSAFEPFTGSSHQLSYYWKGVDYFSEKIGIPSPVACSYGEGLKPNASKASSASIDNARWLPLSWHTRTKRHLKNAVDYALWVADQIRSGQFYKCSKMAYNTPCELCNFSELCISSDAALVNIPTLQTLKFIGGDYVN